MESSFCFCYDQGWGPYNRDSVTDRYGNELFSKNRDTHVWAKDNFVSDDEMPALAACGFSPGVLAVVTADKDASSSDLTVKLGRSQDDYWMDWVSWAGGMHAVGVGWWVGSNNKDIKTSKSTTKYTLNWDKNELVEVPNNPR